MPHYSFLRMQLLSPRRFPALIKTLKGILMLLPQGKAFDSLKNRLECSQLLVDTEEVPQELNKTENAKSEALAEKLTQVFIQENEDSFPEGYRELLDMIM